MGIYHRKAHPASLLKSHRLVAADRRLKLLRENHALPMCLKPLYLPSPPWTPQPYLGSFGGIGLVDMDVSIGEWESKLTKLYRYQCHYSNQKWCQIDGKVEAKERPKDRRAKWVVEEGLLRGVAIGSYMAKAKALGWITSALIFSNALAVDIELWSSRHCRLRYRRLLCWRTRVEKKGEWCQRLMLFMIKSIQDKEGVTECPS